MTSSVLLFYTFYADLKRNSNSRTFSRNIHFEVKYLTYNLYSWSRTSSCDTYGHKSNNSYLSACLDDYFLYVSKEGDSLESKKKPKCLCSLRVTTSLPLKIRGDELVCFFCVRI